MQRTSKGLLNFKNFHFLSNPSKHFRYLLITFSQIHTQTNSSSTLKNPLILNFLIHTLNLPEPKALSISNRFARFKNVENPQSVVHYFRSLGFTDAQIQSSVIGSPQTLFMDVENTLKPKIKLFHDLGFEGPKLGKFISKNSTLLTRSLSNRLKPCIDVIQSILVNNDDLFRVLSRCNWVATRDPEKRLSCNISYLKSCGIVGSQLAMLLVRQPRIFAASESEIKSLVSRVVQLGIPVDSRMFVHGLHAISCVNSQTIAKKFELFKDFGFSEVECMGMFRTTPGLLRTSEDKLRFGLEFYLKTVGLKRSAVAGRGSSLMYSMQDRVVPRYRVLQLMKSKGIMKKEPSFLTVCALAEEEFLDKYISKFPDHALELLVAYKGHLLDSSEEVC